MTVQSEYQLENELNNSKDWGIQQSLSRMKASYCQISKHKLNAPIALPHCQKLNGSRLLAF